MKFKNFYTISTTDEVNSLTDKEMYNHLEKSYKIKNREKVSENEVDLVELINNQTTLKDAVENKIQTFGVQPGLSEPINEMYQKTKSKIKVSKKEQMKPTQEVKNTDETQVNNNNGGNNDENEIKTESK